MKEFCKKDIAIFSYLEENGYSHKKIKRLFSYHRVLIDGRIARITDKVSLGMKIEILPLYKPIEDIEILFENKDILVLNKPSLLFTISTSLEKEKTLYHKAFTYLKRKRESLFVVHRLDRDTSGIVLFAKNKKIKDAFQKNWNTLARSREYTALVSGHLEAKRGTICQYLAENKEHKVYVTTKEKGKLAITSYQVLKEYAHASLVSISIQTGRKNQIRVAFASLGNPIVGDKKYGKKDQAKRLYLHASRLVILHPFTKQNMVFEKDVVKEFDKIGKKV